MGRDYHKQMVHPRATVTRLVWSMTKMLVFFGEDNEEVTRQIWQFDPRRMEMVRNARHRSSSSSKKRPRFQYIFRIIIRCLYMEGLMERPVYSWIYSYDLTTGEWKVEENDVLK